MRLIKGRKLDGYLECSALSDHDSVNAVFIEAVRLGLQAGIDPQVVNRLTIYNEEGNNAVEDQSNQDQGDSAAGGITSSTSVVRKNMPRAKSENDVTATTADRCEFRGLTTLGKLLTIGRKCNCNECNAKQAKGGGCVVM